MSKTQFEARQEVCLCVCLYVSVCVSVCVRVSACSLRGDRRREEGGGRREEGALIVFKHDWNSSQNVSEDHSLCVPSTSVFYLNILFSVFYLYILPLYSTSLFYLFISPLDPTSIFYLNILPSYSTSVFYLYIRPLYSTSVSTSVL